MTNFQSPTLVQSLGIPRIYVTDPAHCDHTYWAPTAEFTGEPLLEVHRCIQCRTIFLIPADTKESA